MPNYTYQQLKKEREQGYNDGYRRGKKQGKKDQLAKLRVYLTTEESRVEREN